MPDPVLSAPAAPVGPHGLAGAAALAEELVRVMRSSPGCVGVAAPQLGVGSRVFVLDVTGHRKAVSCHGLVVLADPAVVERQGAVSAREGCLSVPHLTGDVTRAGRIVVSGTDPRSGAVRVVAADAFEARALQHELDHLDGLLFLDRVDGPHALHARKRYG